MPTARKVAEVAELEDLISRSRVAITADYRGMTVADMAGLRRRLKEIGVEVKVAKITLASLAAQRVGKPRLSEVLRGPSAIAFGFRDEAEPARVITEFVRTTRLSLSVTGALIGDRPITAEEVTRLASLPTREVLIGQVLGSMQSPIAGLVGVLNATLASLVWALQARVRQLETQPSGA